MWRELLFIVFVADLARGTLNTSDDGMLNGVYDVSTQTNDVSTEVEDQDLPARYPTREELGVDYGLECVLRAKFHPAGIPSGHILCMCLLTRCLHPLTAEEKKIRFDIVKSTNAKDLPKRAKKFAAELAVHGLAALIGIPGNILVLVTIAFCMTKSSVTNVLIASLSVSDLLMVLIALPTNMREIVTFYWLGLTEYDRFFCKLVNFLFYFSPICSMLTMLAMSLERYLVVCHPMRANIISSTNRAIKLAVAIWIFSIAVTIPAIFASDIRLEYYCTFRYSTATGRFFTFFVPFGVFLIPLVIMVIAYTRVGQTLMKSIKVTEQLQNKGKMDEKSAEVQGRIQVVKMLVVVLVAFFVLWGPYNFYFIWTNFRRPNYPNINHIKFSFRALAFFSTCVNPILYPIFSKQFRDGFRRALTCKYKEAKSLQNQSRITATSNISSTVDKSAP